MPVFTVDTHLFRELGDLLVGRDSTALFELIKNAYDADATEVTVVGLRLDEPEAGEIVITDNGCGMSHEAFEHGFLRIASRAKDTGDRRSPVFQRRYTGAKGIGRLAAHKLARLLQVHSVSGSPGARSNTGVDAIINWDAIEAQETLDQLQSGHEIIVNSRCYASPVSTGTTITLRNLRRQWAPEERTAFVAECQSFQAPEELTSNLVPRYLPSVLVFQQPLERARQPQDVGFDLILDGDFATGQSLWPSIVGSASWVIEADASKVVGADDALIRIGVGPTVQAISEHQTWVPREFNMFINMPHSIEGPFFHARIFVQVNPKAAPRVRKEVRRESGIRVFVEGFRILPYGEPGNDWLNLDADYARRTHLDFGGKVDELFGGVTRDEHWEELMLPNRSYFGGVFLTQEGASCLRPLINREGFLPDPAFLRLRDTIRLIIDLSTRVRAAATHHERAEAREARRSRRGQSHSETPEVKDPLSSVSAEAPPPEPIKETVADITTTLREARDLLADGRIEEVRAIMERIPPSLQHLEDSAEQLAEEGPMLRVLASVGTQMSTFVHEIKILLGTAQAVENALDRLRTREDIVPEVRQQLAVIVTSVRELRGNLERQASYLLDIATPDASRRRSRQRLVERFESGIRLLRVAAEHREITIDNRIPEDLKSPPMFPAELTTVFSNVLSNAIKAAGRRGRILTTGFSHDRKVIVRIENTGVEVALVEAERWFRPFESTTTEVDSLLGQGMGLGLTITRNMLEPYGATIRFVEPSPSYKTALEIVFPD